MIFPSLYVLNNILKNTNIKFDSKKYFILSVQHLLETTGSLFESIINLGFNPNNIYLTGKIYSTHMPTFNKLKDLGINMVESTIKEPGYYSVGLSSDIKVMLKNLRQKITSESTIIVLDDGGYCLKAALKYFSNKYTIIGIEQTTSGIRNQKALNSYPVIDVASSAIKKLLEPLLISESVIKKLNSFIDKSKYSKIGIVGFGNIGVALARKLVNSFKIRIFDKNKDKYILYPNKKLIFCESLDELYNESEIIIGATGNDISQKSWLSNTKSNKLLISVSSGDIEFNSLLRGCNQLLKNKNLKALQDLEIQTTNNHIIKVLRGGMVANFTGSANSSPKKSIQITRGLLLFAIIQIVKDIKIIRNICGPIMLDPYSQKIIAQYWFENCPNRIKHYKKWVHYGLKNVNFIKSFSNGIYYKNK